MISPYVRTMRLAQELRKLRVDAHLTHEQLSKISGESKPQISRLENGHVVDLSGVMRILEALNVTGEEWTRVMTIAREAGEKGWWETVRGVGERQALVANLEAGAVRIQEYQQTFVPGLLQTPEYVRARCESDAVLKPPKSRVDGIVRGNADRQRMLRRPGAPSYEVIVDEVAIRRPSAPLDVFKRQLDHLAQVVNGDASQPILRVLSIDKVIPDFAVPRCSFAIYTYPDDPPVVATGSVTADQVLTEPDDIDSYQRLYDRLSEVAGTPGESLALIAATAGPTGT